MIDIGERATHPVTIYTPREVFPANLMVPDAVRFSSWLTNQEGTLLARAQIDGVERDILLNRPYLEAIVDEIPPHIELTSVRPTVPVPVMVLFDSGLRITGNMHLFGEADFVSCLRFETDNSLRVLTEAAISFHGKPVREGATAIINLDRAVYVAQL
jgi:hypothetical protein